MLSRKLSTEIAPRSFALGLACGMSLAGIAFVIHGERTSDPAGDATAVFAMAAGDASWRHPAPTGSLESAVMASQRLLISAGTAAMSSGVATPGSDTQALLARAEQHRRNREFAVACDLYAGVATRGGMTADAWADYADAQASLSGQLSGPPARAIDAALALDAAHPKALWLKASLAHEERRYADALETWQRLLSLVPSGSSDATIIQANIAEASRLAAG